MQTRKALFLRLAPFLMAKVPHPRDLMWPITALYTRSILAEAGVPATVIDTWQRVLPPEALLERILTEDPTHVFLETRTPTADTTLALARQLKARRPDTVIWGIGQHASEKPEDFVFDGSPFAGTVSGELEPVVPRILDGQTAVEGTIVWDGTAAGLRRIGDRAMVQDCDALPILDPKGLEIERYRMLSLHIPTFRRPRWGYLLTSRGCAYQCIFCSPTLRQSYGTSFRGQSPERVAEEMAYLNQQYGIDSFYAIDDLFTGDQKRVHGICEAILKRNLQVRWTVQTRMDHLDRALLKHMRRAGCVGIKVGIETGNERIGNLLKKELDPDRALEMAREIERLGINLTACFLVGNPSETIEEMEQTFQFAKRIGALMCQVAYHTPYPGSESFDRFAQDLEVNGKSHFDGMPTNLSQVSDDQLIRFHRNFYLRYYLSPHQFLRYLRRRALYKLFRADELGLFASTAKYLVQEGLKRKLGMNDAHPLET